MGDAPTWSQNDRVYLNRENETKPKNGQIMKIQGPVLRGSHQPWLPSPNVWTGQVTWLKSSCPMVTVFLVCWGLKWHLAERFLQTACCNVMQCLEGIKAIAPGSKLQHCTCRYKVSFQEKGTSRWEQPPWSVRQVYWQWDARVGREWNQGLGPWTMMRSKSAEASLRNYKSWECHERIVPPFRGRSASALLFSSRWLFACLSHSGAPQGINRSIEKHGFTSSLAQLMRSRHCETEAAPLCGVKPRRMPQPISHTAICSIAQPGISSGTMLSQARWFSSFVIAGLHPAYVYIHIHNVYIYITICTERSNPLPRAIQGFFISLFDYWVPGSASKHVLTELVAQLWQDGIVVFNNPK
jgi:hypothetical protein